MRKFICLFIIFFSLVTTNVMAKNIMILKLSYGEVEIELYPEKAPNHVERFKKLAEEMPKGPILLLENDLELVENKKETYSQLQKSINLLNAHELIQVRLRSRTSPGEPFVGLKKYKNYFILRWIRKFKNFIVVKSKITKQFFQALF